MTRIVGTDGADTLIGTNGDDEILGRGGNDLLKGGNGNDVFRPGDGKDIVFGGAGDDTVFVTEYDERFPDIFHGQAGFDTLDLSRAPTTDGDNRDYYFEWEYFASKNTYSITDFFNDDEKTITFDGFEKMVGSSGIDYFRFSDASTSFTISAGTGDDYVSAGSGNDTIDGGDGDDDLYGGGGRNVLLGGKGADFLSMDDSIGGRIDGGTGRDTVLAYGSIDLEKGTGLSQSGHRYSVSNVEDLDVQFGAIGSVATGDKHANRIYATYSFADVTLNGGGGNDYLIGSAGGKDTLNGGDGNDRLRGNSSADILIGGAGRDIFDMTGYDNQFISENIDIIRDFSQADGDKLYLWAAAGNHSITLVGEQGFSHTEYEVRYDQHNGKTYIQLDRDGDGTSDLDVTLVGTIDIRLSDFINEYRPEPLRDYGATVSTDALSHDISAHSPPFPLQDLGLMATV